MYYYSGGCDCESDDDDYYGSGLLGSGLLGSGDYYGGYSEAALNMTAEEIKNGLLDLLNQLDNAINYIQNDKRKND